MNSPKGMNGWWSSVPERTIPSLRFHGSSLHPALSSAHHSCLSLPLTVSHVLSLTPSGYFQIAPSHCLIYFHVRNMISESPTSFFPHPPVDWPECTLSENDVAWTAGKELN